MHVNLGIARYARGEVAEGDRELRSLRQLFGEERAKKGESLAAVRKVPPGDRVRAVDAINHRFDDPIAHLRTSLLALESYHRLASGFFLNRTQLAGWLAVLLAVEVALVWLTRRRIRLALLTVVPALAVCGWLIHANWALINLPDGLTDVDLGYLSQRLLEAGAEQAEPAREYAEDGPANVLTQANLVEVLYRIGKQDEARKVFEELRGLAAMADLDSPPFARLAPIARAFGYSTDWRLPAEIQKSLAGRPPLPSLGPLLWRPWTALDWKLKDAAGVEHSLADFHGQPVLLVFFLGHGCLHCKEQLEAFVKREQQISEAGLKLVAISTDNQAGIKGSLADYGPIRFPFLMVADPELKTFQAYRAYDSFEQIALHAIFLIDGAGLCRWQDVGLNRSGTSILCWPSQRLLLRPVAPLEPGARVIPD